MFEDIKGNSATTMPNNPYMNFCAQARDTAAWKARAKGLGVAEQGVLLGQLYRGSKAKPSPKVAPKVTKPRSHTLSFTVSGEPKLTPKEEKRIGPYGIMDMAAWIEGSMADTCPPDCNLLYACETSVKVKRNKSGYDVTFQLTDCEEDVQTVENVQTVKESLRRWLRKKFKSVK